MLLHTISFLSKKKRAWFPKGDHVLLRIWGESREKSSDGERRSGCVVNTLSQVTSKPPRLSVAVSKENYTTDIIRKSGYFTGTVLSKNCLSSPSCVFFSWL